MDLHDLPEMARNGCCPLTTLNRVYLSNRDCSPFTTCYVQSRDKIRYSVVRHVYLHPELMLRHAIHEKVMGVWVKGGGMPAYDASVRRVDTLHFQNKHTRVKQMSLQEFFTKVLQPLLS